MYSDHVASVAATDGGDHDDELLVPTLLRKRKCYLNEFENHYEYEHEYELIMNMKIKYEILICI